MKNPILITGVRGQDGAYLARALFSMGLNVVGISHEFAGEYRLPLPPFSPITVQLVQMDQTDQIVQVIRDLLPAAVFHLAARSSSQQLSDDPLASLEINAMSTGRFLEAIRLYSPRTRFILAASSEIFAGCSVSPQSEELLPRPVNAYGVSKLMAMQMVQHYRDAYGLHASSAILFNHESPLRPDYYVTQKIVKAAVAISLGRQSSLTLGDLLARRDWMHASDAALGMIGMFNQQFPSDYVLSSGVLHSVEQLCDLAFSEVGLNFLDHVTSLPDTSRRAERIQLHGDNSKAKTQLGWEPKISFRELIQEMIGHELTKFQSPI